MSELRHECGVVAVYHLPGAELSGLCPRQGPEQASRLLPQMLQDIQNRGQLAAGITTYAPERDELLATYKHLGTVSEVFRLSHRGKRESLMKKFAGRAGIGHVRYATCGQDDLSYAQPFERLHLVKNKWFSFAFNGQLANYRQLREGLLSDGQHHLARESDTEVIMHEVSRELSTDPNSPLFNIMQRVSQRFDGAYTIAMLNACGEMLLARDPLGIKPLTYAHEGPLFAAASESVALINLGFRPDQIRSLAPGHTLTVSPRDGVKIQSFSDDSRSAHCFFEWIYFANVASTLDDRGVYLTRTALGEELARAEQELGQVPLDEQTIVVPVPDTSKAAADSMAFNLGIPSREGLIRNRYSGRTFIEGSCDRKQAAQRKYTPLREVMEDKRVLLVEDSIVRSTTMRVLLRRIRDEGKAREIHVRVACPPIIAPCFYGIDMSTIDELFAPHFVRDGRLTDEAQVAMAQDLGADSLRYLPVSSVARAIGMAEDRLCRACITGDYPTPWGQQLYQIALGEAGSARGNGRTYEGRRPTHSMPGRP